MFLADAMVRCRPRLCEKTGRKNFFRMFLRSPLLPHQFKANGKAGRGSPFCDFDSKIEPFSLKVEPWPHQVMGIKFYQFSRRTSSHTASAWSTRPSLYMA